MNLCTNTEEQFSFKFPIASFTVGRGHGEVGVPIKVKPDSDHNLFASSKVTDPFCPACLHFLLNFLRRQNEVSADSQPH
jgi:hypothetical protein